MEKGDQQVTRRRSRGGCINCKRSKRKCDEAKPFCQNCSRRKIKCEGYKGRCIFEDDPIRQAIKKRGFGSTKRQSKHNQHKFATILKTKVNNIPKSYKTSADTQQPQTNYLMNLELSNQYTENIPEKTYKAITDTSPLVNIFQSGAFLSPLVSNYPNLSCLEIYFLELYKHNFALQYPFFTDYENPFYKHVVPIAYNDNDVRCAISVLCGQVMPLNLDDTIMLEYKKRKRSLKSVISVYLEYGIKRLSTYDMSVLMFLMISILLFEKNTHIYDRGLEEYLVVVGSVFQNFTFNDIYANNLALLSFKVFIYNDLMSSLINNRIPVVSHFSEYQDIVTNYPFIHLVVVIQKFRSELSRSPDDPLVLQKQDGLRYMVKALSVRDVVSWFPSFFLKQSNLDQANLIEIISLIYKRHLLFYLEVDEVRKKNIATSIYLNIMKLPNKYNNGVGVLPQIRSILEYLDDAEMVAFRKKMELLLLSRFDWKLEEITWT